MADPPAGPELATLRLRVLDTSAVVAYLDADDPSHAAVADALESGKGRIATTSAVVTESMHFVADVPGGPRSLAELLAAARAEVYDFSSPADLPPVVALMELYANVPMDFADATLVLAAEALGAHEVLTLDRRGFSVYRLRSGRALRVLPGR